LKKLYLLKLNDFSDSRALIITLLVRLWKNTFKKIAVSDNLDLEWRNSDDLSSEEEAKILKNINWQYIGFQSPTPVTDFRSMGVLSLWCLVYISDRNCPKFRSKKILNFDSRPLCFPVFDIPRAGWIQKMASYHKLADHSTESHCNNPSKYHHRQYPWAAAGVNVAQIILCKFLSVDEKILSMGVGPPSSNVFLNYLSYLEPSMCLEPGRKDIKEAKFSSAFEELFCFCMDLLDRLYIITNAGYMDFPIIMRRLESIVFHWISGTKPEKPISDKFDNILEISFNNRKPISLEELWSLLEKNFKIKE
jgi:hypothetical protein